MAEDREPPPFGEDQIDEDDLFADANEKSELIKTDIKKPEPEPAILNNNEEISLDDDDDLFKEPDTTEIKLDSDDEDKSKNPFEDASLEPDPSSASVRPLVTEPIEDTPKINVSESSTSSSTASSKPKTVKVDDAEEKDKFVIDIKIPETQKMGDGMGAYIVYRVVTKTTIPVFRKPELSVLRRFSDFLGLHHKLAEKHSYKGIIVPPAPEKSVLGMTKVKMSKEESGSMDFVERRKAALQRYLNRTAAHPVLRVDPDFREFLEKDGDLPKATSTSALSGAGVMRLFHKIGDSVEKMTFKMDETDEWFEEKQQQIESLDTQLKKLHSSVESLVQHRRELSMVTAAFAKSCAMLGNAEEHTALSRALSQLAETEEKVEQLHKEQSDSDFFTMSELLKDYIALIGSVKEVFHERVKIYKTWKDAESTLHKKRENKAKLEVQHKTDKISQAQQEITEWEDKVHKGQDDFEKISETVRREVARFDKLRVEDFKESVITYLEHLMETQQNLIKYWEAFMPEAKAIA